MEILELPKDFMGAERNLELLGFFSPSYKERRILRQKTISGTVYNQAGRKVRVEVKIIPSTVYGLPVTTDLDIYRAFQKILKDIYLEEGEITNPVTFKDEQIIKNMGKSRKGDLTKQIRQWLHRMNLTGILSEGWVYHKKKKETISDLVKVFDRSVAYGKELPDGTTANRNYVWLSNWYLNNLNTQYAFLLDNELHKRLRKPLAKSLYPILWFGFYGLRKQNGQFYWRRYAAKKGRAGDSDHDGLCDLLGIKEHSRLSWIKRDQFEPAHEELLRQGVLARWAYERTADGQTYNIKWWPGPAFDLYYAGLMDRKLKTELLPEGSPPLVAPVGQGETALRLVLYFQQQKNNLTLYSPTTKELQQAAQLIAEHSEGKARQVVNFAIAQMNKTTFKAVYFGSVLQYVNEALKTIALAEETERVDSHKQAAEHQANLKIYKWWRQASPEERIKERLEAWQQIRETLDKRPPTTEEIAQRTSELLDSEPTAKEKQQLLFGRIIFPDDCPDPTKE